MKKLLLSLALLLGTCLGAAAQVVPCIGVGGINSVPQVGITCASEPSNPSYGATSIGLVPGAAATDIACIGGAANKVIRIQQIKVTGSGTAIAVPVIITKHVSLDTGGTLSLTTAIPVPYAMDSNNAAAVATTRAWTANPTIADAAPGFIDSSELGVAATSVGVISPPVVFDYRERNFIQAPVLRKATEEICVNLNATSPTALLNVTFQWTEAAQ